MSNMATPQVSVTALPAALGAELRRIPEVDSAYTAMHGGRLVVRVFVTEYTDEVLDKLFDIEADFFDSYHQAIFIEALAKPLDKDIHEVFPGMMKMYPRPF